MQAHQQRVVAEQQELSERLQGLTTFIAGPKWSEVDLQERRRLVRQLSLMEQLDHVLLERIHAFKGQS